MADAVEIRDSAQADGHAIEALYPAAFPDEELLPLVDDLLRDTDNTVSLVATVGADVAGHIVFTLGGVAGTDATVALLGPLAVAPARHRQGIGSALVRAGLVRMQDAGVDLVCVLGDPAYYGRFGFVPERDIEPPYALPKEWRDAWQSQHLPGSTRTFAGTLSLPAPWLQPALWAP